MPISETWLQDGINKFIDDRVAGVYCNPLYPLDDATIVERIILLAARLIRIKLRWWKETEIIKRPGTGVMGTTNAIIRKDLWDKYHFNLSFANGGEDGDWIAYWMERGFVAIRDVKFTVRHSHSVGLIDYLKQYFHWRIECASPHPFKYKKHKFN